MSSISWPRHFLLLLVGAALVPIGNALDIEFQFLFFMAHPFALVIAAVGRPNTEFPIRVLFVIGAGLLHGLAMMFGASFEPLFLPLGTLPPYLATFLPGAAFGALTYAWLVRKIFFPQISSVLMLLIVPLACSLTIFFIAHFFSESSQKMILYPWVPWWFAFSISTYFLWQFNGRSSFK